MTGRDKLSTFLKYLQIIFYLAFLFLWFKDNFPLFKNVNISYLIPFIPLIIITVIRILFRFRQRKISLRIRFGKTIFALVVLILIATAIRIPFLVYNFGLLTSDDAISSLVAKHISEGKLPPVYHYGVDYLGTFAYHIYALVFKIFGYSIFVIVFSYFIFYLCFIIIQFLFFKDIFSSYNLSLVLSLFYCLPIGNLLAVSFFVGSNLSLVLLLGSLSVYLSFLVYKKDKDNLIPLIGFCLGLSFWIHSITIYFLICSFIFIVLKFKFILKKYLKLMIYLFIGIFPVILNAIFLNYSTFNYLFSGKKIQIVPWEKIKEIIVNIMFLISAEKTFFNYIYIFLIFLGIIGLIYLSLKKRKFLPENIFVIFFFVFLLVYSFSRFPADVTKIRYLYPLYFALPFLLVSIFSLLRRKIKYIVMLILFSIIFFSNIKGTYTNYLLVKRAHINLKNIIYSMETTGQKYWAGDFWQVILITGLSGEKIVGYSYSDEQYFPYKLWYFNRGDNNNFIFFKEVGSYAVRYKEFLPLIDKNLDRNFDQANNLIDFLNRYNIRAHKEKIGEFCWLIYDASTQIFPWAFKVPIPEQIPELELAKIECSEGFLFISIKNKQISEKGPFRLHFEVPNYSSVLRGLPLGREKIKLRIPFPPKKSFKIRYYIDYKGLTIPSTLRETIYSPSDQDLSARRKGIMYLTGFSPVWKIFGKRRRICEKEANFEINKLLNKNSTVRLYLFSPFSFSDPFWYENYFQEIRIEINGDYLSERRLDEGENIIEFDLKNAKLHKVRNFIKLKFKYHLPFKFNRLWKTSALLEKIEIR